MSNDPRRGLGGNFPPPENLADLGAPCMILERATGEIEIKGPTYERVSREMQKYPHSFGNIIEEDNGRWSCKGRR